MKPKKPTKAQRARWEKRAAELTRLNDEIAANRWGADAEKYGTTRKL